MKHEIFLTVEEEDGVKVISGCSHHGIRNILANVHKTPVTAVVGGFHMEGHKAIFRLYAETTESIKRTAEQLKSIPHVYTGHCTGGHAYKILHRICGARPLITGTTFEI